jgi:hypothetical protein
MRFVRATDTDGSAARDRRRAGMAGAVAWGGWAAVSLGCGVAVALAQYASLADGDPDRLNLLATVIAGGGAGLALLAWLWWLVVNVGLWRAGVPPAAGSGATGCVFFLSIVMAVGGAAVMAVGGNADSIAPPALLALGLGCACTIGGFLALFGSCGHWFVRDLWADRRVRAEVRAAAAARGVVAREPSRALTALSVVGFIVPATAMIGCYAVGPWLAAGLHLPVVVAEGTIIVLGAVLCFPSLAAFVTAHTSTHELVAAEDARAYGYRAAGLATAAFVAIGVLPLLHLGWLVVVVFFGLAMLAGRLRGRYLGRL